jgi:hypothetical protein
MHPVIALVEVLLIASGVFFLAAAVLDGKPFHQRMPVSRHDMSGRHALAPRTIRQTLLG